MSQNILHCQHLISTYRQAQWKWSPYNENDAGSVLLMDRQMYSLHFSKEPMFTLCFLTFTLLSFLQHLIGISVAARCPTTEEMFGSPSSGRKTSTVSWGCTVNGPVAWRNAQVRFYTFRIIWVWVRKTKHFLFRRWLGVRWLLGAPSWSRVFTPVTEIILLIWKEVFQLHRCSTEGFKLCPLTNLVVGLSSSLQHIIASPSMPFSCFVWCKTRTR